jgi:hypothetical protein
MPKKYLRNILTVQDKKFTRAKGSSNLMRKLRIEFWLNPIKLFFLGSRVVVGRFNVPQKEM